MILSLQIFSRAEKKNGRNYLKMLKKMKKLWIVLDSLNFILSFLYHYKIWL